MPVRIPAGLTDRILDIDPLAARKHVAVPPTTSAPTIGSSSAQKLKEADKKEADKSVPEVLASNFKQFGGLIKSVPRIFAHADCRTRDLGQLLARAHFWLRGMKGRDRARRSTFHNRFVEVFFRCWNDNNRGMDILASEKGTDPAYMADALFLLSQVEDLLAWAGNSPTFSADPELPSLTLSSIQCDLRALLDDRSAAPPGRGDAMKAAPAGPRTCRSPPDELTPMPYAAGGYPADYPQVPFSSRTASSQNGRNYPAAQHDNWRVDSGMNTPTAKAGIYGEITWETNSSARCSSDSWYQPEPYDFQLPAPGLHRK